MWYPAVMRHGIGIDDDHLSGATLTSDGLGTAVSEAAGYEAVNATTADENTSWKPSAAGVNKLRIKLAETEDIGAAAVAVTGMDGPDDCFRLRSAAGGMEKPSAPLQAGTTAVDTAETADWTLGILARLEPLNLTTATDDIAEIRLTGASSTSTRLVQIAVGAAGNPLIRLERMGGGANEQDFTSAGQIDTCRPFVIYVSFTDTGGSGGDATVYLSNPALGTITSIGTVSTAVAFGSGTVRAAISGNHHVGRLELWNRALTAAEVAQFAPFARVATDSQLEIGLNVTETTGTTLADITGGHDMTIGAGTYSVITNPLAAYNPEPRPRHQPWRKRHAIGPRTADVTTSTDLDASPLFSVAMWIRFPSGPTFGVGEPEVIYFGTDKTSGNYEWTLDMRTTGQLRAYVGRYAGGEVNMDIAAADIMDGDWHVVSLVCGWAGACSLGLDGFEQDTATASAYTANAASKLVFRDMAGAVYDFAGPVIIAQRPYTHAELYAICTGSAPVIPGVGSAVPLHYRLTEGTGTTAANGGTEASGDLTVASADWLANACDNLEPGPKRDPAKRIAATAWEIADGANHASDEVLLEIYSAGVPVVYAVCLAEVIWPSVMSSTVNADGAITARAGSIDGPSPERSRTGALFGGPEAIGRRPQVSLSMLTEDEAAELVAWIARAPQTWYQGAVVASKWIAIIHAPSDSRHWQWADLCAIILPEMPREEYVAAPAFPGTAAALERSLTVTGRQLFCDLT